MEPSANDDVWASRRGDADRRPAYGSPVLWVVGPLLGIVAIALMMWWMRPSNPAEEFAREDVRALADAVAAHVADAGRLPRITVEPADASADFPDWGPDFLVESTRVPRANPDDSLQWYLVGEPDGWCVEVLYSLDATVNDAAPTAWVSATGAGDEAGEVRGGRCGDDYVLHLSQTDRAPALDPGTVVEAWQAPEGACLVHPFTGQSQAGVLDDTGQVEIADCREPHGGEILAAGVLVDVPADQVWEQAAELCHAAYRDGIGVPSNFSQFAIEAFAAPEPVDLPGADSPPGADPVGPAHPYVCLAYMGDDDYPLVGTAHDSWR